MVNNMTVKRAGDLRSRPVFRSDRIIKEGDKWFFYTREGTLQGPFHDRKDAENQVEVYIKVINSGLIEHELAS